MVYHPGALSFSGWGESHMAKGSFMDMIGLGGTKKKGAKKSAARKKPARKASRKKRG